MVIIISLKKTSDGKIHLELLVISPNSSDSACTIVSIEKYSLNILKM